MRPAGHSRAAAVELVGVSKNYGGVRALTDVSLCVFPGETVGIIGANGAGKSTLLRAIVGAGRFSGSARIFGRDLREWSSLGGVAGSLIGDASGHPGRRVEDHIGLMATLTGATADACAELARRFGVQDFLGRRLGALSLGMRRRVEILCTFLGRPSILLLDEPFNGLDPDGVACLRGNILRAANDGACVVVASHHLAELGALVGRVVLMAAGEIVEDASTEAFIARHGERRVLTRSNDNTTLGEALDDRALTWSYAPGRPNTMLLADVTTETVAHVAADAGVLLLELRYKDNGLEEAFHGAQEPKGELAWSLTPR